MPDLKIKPPYYGCEYIPDVFDEKDIDFDIAMMKKVGINLVKIGIDSWRIIEKTKGNFDFSFYKNLITKLSKAEIGVCFSFPVYDFPTWLKKERQRLITKGFCFSDMETVNFALYMMKKVAAALENFENIVCFNVTVPETETCYCEDCRKLFSEFLFEKYSGSIEKLNYTLFTSYTSFDDILYDTVGILMNTQMSSEWEDFRQNRISSLILTAKDVLKTVTKKPFTVTLPVSEPYLFSKSPLSDFPTVTFDYSEKNGRLPFYTDTFKNQNLKKFVSFSSFNKADEILLEKREENFHRYRALLPLLSGADGSVYWFFKNQRSGKYSENEALLSSEGRPTLHFQKAVKIGEDIRNSAEFLQNTRSFSSVAIQYSSFSKQFFSFEDSFRISDYDALFCDIFYDAVRGKGFSCDVIENFDDGLSDYKLLISPMTVTLEKYGNLKKIKDWVSNGGIWICGPLSDIRNENAVKYKRAPFGNLESMTGAYLFNRIYSKKPLRAVWKDGKPFESYYWYDVFEKTDGDPVVFDEEGFENRSLVKVSNYGKGKIVLLGTFPSFTDMEKIIDEALGNVKIPKFRCSRNVYFGTKKGYDDFGKEYKGVVLAEFEGKEGNARLTKPYVDLLSGKMMKGIIKIKPYDVFVLEEVSEK